ncbi:oxidoreductase [Pasteurellaceae bacterium Pebbles2]|nr:oxidoreductase [Pasteurellaceae bacterium Pebbles2]
MRTLNVAIAGSGYSARLFHIPFLKANPAFQVKKVYERSTNRAAEWLPEVKIVREFEQLLSEDIDLVIITTPNQTHYDMVKQAILAKKHVLVEKPLVATSAQATELITLAQANNVVLYVYQNRRWDSHIATAKQILAQNLLGEIVDCEIRIDRYAKSKNAKVWKETGEQGTGLMYDLGVHLIDQAVYLFGKPQAVFADVRSQHQDSVVDDNFDVHLYYENGLKVALLASKYVRESSTQFTLHGKLGSYIKARADNQENLLIQGVNPVNDWNKESEQDWGILHTEIDGEVIRQSYPNVQTGYQALFANLYAAIVENQPLLVQPEQAAFVLHIIEQAIESAKIGKKLPL